MSGHGRNRPDPIEVEVARLQLPWAWTRMAQTRVVKIIV